MQDLIFTSNVYLYTEGRITIFVGPVSFVQVEKSYTLFKQKLNILTKIQSLTYYWTIVT